MLLRAVGRAVVEDRSGVRPVFCASYFIAYPLGFVYFEAILNLLLYRPGGWKLIQVKFLGA